MKIAVSADCFSAFTSGFPVRGMMLELIKLRKNDIFVLFYTKRSVPDLLKDFYEEINNLPNVEIRYFRYSRKMVALRRMFGLSIIENTSEFSLFINPGNPEVWRNITCPHICSIADFSTIKGMSTGKYASFYKIFNRISLKYMFSHISKIVPISKYTEQDLFDLWPEFKGKTQVVYNGIDDIWFDERIDDCAINPFEDASYYIWWGVISRRKNIENLIKAYNLAKSENPDIPNLLLVGRVEDYMENIKGLFNEHIVNIPFQENYVLKGLVRNSSGLLFPSFYEGFGLPVIEAYSQGIPVACSNVSSLPEIADDYAILFDPKNIEEIKNCIIELADRCVDGETLRSYASMFNYRKAAIAYSEIFDELI